MFKFEQAPNTFGLRGQLATKSLASTSHTRAYAATS